MEPYTPENETSEVPTDDSVLGPNDPDPVVISPLHFALLWFATLGVYSIWWQYKCWKYFKEKEEDDIWPAVRAILFIIFGIELFNKIAAYCRQYDHETGYNSVVIWLSVILCNLLSRLPSPYLWLSLLGFIPFLLPVQELNFYFTGNKKGYVNDKLNDRQIMLLITGGLFWLLLLYSLIMGDPAAANS